MSQEEPKSHIEPVEPEKSESGALSGLRPPFPFYAKDKNGLCVLCGREFGDHASGCFFATVKSDWEAEGLLNKERKNYLAKILAQTPKEQRTAEMFISLCSQGLGYEIEIAILNDEFPASILTKDAIDALLKNYPFDISMFIIRLGSMIEKFNPADQQAIAMDMIYQIAELVKRDIAKNGMSGGLALETEWLTKSNAQLDYPRLYSYFKELLQSCGEEIVVLVLYSLSLSAPSRFQVPSAELFKHALFAARNCNIEIVFMHPDVFLQMARDDQEKLMQIVMQNEVGGEAMPMAYKFTNIILCLLEGRKPTHIYKNIDANEYVKYSQAFRHHIGRFMLAVLKDRIPLYQADEFKILYPFTRLLELIDDPSEKQEVIRLAESRFGRII